MPLNWLVPASGGSLLLAYRLWKRRRRARALARSLESINDLGEANLNHLTPGLARVVRQSQHLRLLLETPLRRSEIPLWSESPWARRARCDAYDQCLVEVRRALYDWMAEVESLAPQELALLAQLGITPRPFQELLFGSMDRTDDPWEQVLYPAAPDLDRTQQALVATMHELRRFEAALTAGPMTPYRA